MAIYCCLMSGCRSAVREVQQKCSKFQMSQAGGQGVCGLVGRSTITGRDLRGRVPKSVPAVCTGMAVNTSCSDCCREYLCL